MYRTSTERRGRDSVARAEASKRKKWIIICKFGATRTCHTCDSRPRAGCCSLRFSSVGVNAVVRLLGGSVGTKQLREGPIVAAAVNGVPGCKVLYGITLTLRFNISDIFFFSNANNTTSRDNIEDGTRLKLCLLFDGLVSLTGTLVSSYLHPVVDRCTCVRLMTLEPVLCLCQLPVRSSARLQSSYHRQEPV